MGKVRRSFKAKLQNQIQKFRHWLPISSQTWLKLELLKALVGRNLEARYKGSILGNLWPLINQLIQLLIYTYVFSIVLKVKLSLRGLPDNDFTFGLWLFAGLLPWTAFSNGLLQATVAVVEQPNLVKKVVFPLALLPLVPICATFVESMIGLATLLVMVAFTTKSLPSTLVLLPLVWIPQLLLAMGLGYLTSALTVFLRDIPQTLGVALNFWFYLTPIIYPASAIPAEWRQWILWLNPMTTIAELYRDIILTGTINHQTEWGFVLLLSIGLFAIGISVYRRLRPAFADVL